MFKKFLGSGVLLLGLMLLLSACGQQKPANSDSGQTKVAADLSVYKNGDVFITPQELQKKLGDKSAILVDTNKPDVYEKGHIPGAIGIGWHGLSKIVGKPGDPLWGTTLDKEELTKKLESYGVTNSTLVVFTSNLLPGPGSDGRSVWQLRMAGLDNVKLLYGGNPYWKELGFEMTKEAPPKPFSVTGLTLKEFDKSYSADKAYIYANLGKTVIIDVRTEKEYKGSQDSGEARGGHIQGAKHLVWSSLLNENGTPKSPEVIIKMMADLGVTPQDDFVVY
ncbi:sulfurtransferase [Desulfosporosinus sp. BICA1-9]|uniref:sulfurtransferase n=1 Tax=Desulfosporosinus sp. BICA1-9 TaxID=1531958 RepID=UPI000A8B4644|nr:rhodanese-like domain-containing protein [Desulfosporosinus sp. BICA1-9]